MRTYLRLKLYIGVITATTLGVVGCTSSQPQDYELEARYVIANENWETCKLAYSQRLVATVSIHSHRRGMIHRPYQVQEDLISNHCRFILGKYWINY